MLILSLTGLTVATVTGNLWILAVVFAIPQRIAITLLGWWFDWLPHHGLEVIKRSSRYSATRVRVGMESLFIPLMLSQNYHGVHHQHPGIPFYRYGQMWRDNEEAYLERNIAIATVFGQQLNPVQYREWKCLNRKLWRFLPVRKPASSRFPNPKSGTTHLRRPSCWTIRLTVLSTGRSSRLRGIFSRHRPHHSKPAAVVRSLRQMVQNYYQLPGSRRLSPDVPRVVEYGRQRQRRRGQARPFSVIALTHAMV
jgi:fatty acid desaturase